MIRRKTTRDSYAIALRLVRTFHEEIVREKSLLFVSAATVLAAVAFRVLEPWPLKFIYDSIFHAKQHGLPLAALRNLSPQAVVAISAASMVAITGLAGTFDYASSVSMARAASQILAEIRGRLFRHLANLSVSFHGRNKTGDLITHVTYDIDRMREVTVSSLLPFLTNTLTLTAMIVVMLGMNWQLGCLVLVAFPLFFAAVYRLTKRIKEVAREQRTREGAIASTTAETITSIRTVQALSLQGRFLDVFSIANKKSLQAGNKVQELAAGLERTVDLLATSTTAVVLWFGVHKVLHDRLTPGDLIVFVNYLRVAFKPIRQLAKYLGQMAKALASGDHILALLGTTAEIQDKPHSVPARPFLGHICFENVSFTYESGNPVLRNISFEAEPGQRVVLVGPSGSGKSTLASLLLRFHDPVNGRILIDGRDIRDYTLESLRSQISIVMQDSPLFAVSVRDNIAFGTSTASTEDVVSAARMANAHDFIQQMPRQYDTVVGEHGSTLSGGQRQRIAIARAAIRKSPIIILDEPTTGLDRKNEREVTAALNRLSAGHTTLLITHDLQAAQDADLVLFLCEGRIRERGTHQSLLALGGEYAAMFNRQTVWNSHQETICAVNA
jgi:ATP-binding cassette subfamily B protein